MHNWITKPIKPFIAFRNQVNCLNVAAREMGTNEVYLFSKIIRHR